MRSDLTNIEPGMNLGARKPREKPEIRIVIFVRVLSSLALPLGASSAAAMFAEGKRRVCRNSQPGLDAVAEAAG
jgi:hypothetical protein